MWARSGQLCAEGYSVARGLRTVSMLSWLVYGFTVTYLWLPLDDTVCLLSGAF